MEDFLEVLNCSVAQNTLQFIFEYPAQLMRRETRGGISVGVNYELTGASEVVINLFSLVYCY
jgi:hypothetical protein